MTLNKYFEPFLIERIEASKKRAQTILDGEITTEEELEMTLRVVISRYYRIPLFDKYFDDRTLDDLIFEVQIINQPTVEPEEAALGYVNDNMDAAIAAVEDAWEEINDIVPPSQEELDRMNQFMNTGKFEGEEPSEF